ncbi:MAG: thioredoxin [Candidatus Bathyarchaeia archaeon]
MDKTSIEQILTRCKTVAIVGISRNRTKASYQVAEYLQRQGYHIIPVNPVADKILHQKAYKSLLDMPLEIQKTIEIVDIFRPSEVVMPIIDQAIQLKNQHGKLCVVWMQLGITNQQAAEKAQKAELTVIMDKCIMREHKLLFEEKEDPELEKIRAKKIQELMRKTKSGEKISTPITITDANFNEMVKKHPLMVIDCWATWCGPCHMIAPIIEELAKEHADEIVFGKLNVDENPETATRFGIMGIPTLLIMKNGAEVDRMVGVAPKILIENKLKKYV